MTREPFRLGGSPVNTGVLPAVGQSDTVYKDRYTDYGGGNAPGHVETKI